MVRALVTAGPTREPIDPVRFISNASSGRQAAALASEALARSWRVDVVCGPLEVELPPGAARHPVSTAAEMLEACLRLHPSADVVIGAAAVSDFRPARFSPAKRPRGDGAWMLELVPTPDILAALGPLKGDRIHAGFALESEDLVENARRKLREKNLDLIVANPVEAVGSSESRYHLISADGSVRELGRLTKLELARALVDEIARLLGYRHRDVPPVR